GRRGVGKLVWGRQLRMRWGRGVDRKTSRVADIGNVIMKLQSIDKSSASIPAAGKLEPDETAIVTAEIAVCALAINTLLERRVNNASHLFPLEQKIDYRLGILAVLPHPHP